MIIKKEVSLFITFIVIVLSTASISIHATTMQDNNNMVISLDKSITNGEIVLEKFLYNNKDGIPFGVAVFDYTERNAKRITEDLKISSSNENVVMVDRNGLFAVEPGEANVTYEYQQKRKTYKIKVIDPKPISYSCSIKEIVLSNKGLSKYIEIFAETEKGNVKINKAIEWSIKDINVASIEEDGWVFAVSQGTTEIICKYNDNEIIIPVTVLSSDYNKIMQDFLKEQSNNQKQQYVNLSPNRTINSRDDIIHRCSEMFNWDWTPTEDLPKWGAGVFEENVRVRGIPYSQNKQCDGDGSLTSGHGNYYGNGTYQTGGFAAAMQLSNFYTPVYLGTDDTPRYGSDCSGFASIAYDQDRMNTNDFENEIANDVIFHKVGNYTIKDNYNTGELTPFYALLERGDGLVKNYWANGKLYGHVVIVGVNCQTGIITYEQIQPITDIRHRYYSDLEQSDYMPFTYF